MPYRKVPLANGETYHICSKSIANFIIFNSNRDYKKILNLISFYVFKKVPCKFSQFLRLTEKVQNEKLRNLVYSKKLVEILTYCIMPTHIHLVLKQLEDDGISQFINLVLKSYSAYFNLLHNRKGPLWEQRFKNALIKDDYLFTHITRYIHLNPVTAYLADRPEDWAYSSYAEYINTAKSNKKLCNFSEYLDMDEVDYTKFVNDQIGYQRELALIKSLILE